MNHPLPPPTRVGKLEAAVQKLFTRSVKVVKVAAINDAFRLITLGGPALREAAFTPGDKLQIQLGGWVQRTYTPFDWDGVAGTARILVCLHAGGPGAQWARVVRSGDTAILFGPRKSLQLAASDAATIVCGDESALGVAAALARHGAAPVVRVLLEVVSLAQTLPVLAPLGLDGAQLCVREKDDGHLPALAAQLNALLQLDGRATVVLTGRASTIQHLGRMLKACGHATAKRHSKAYWADGKTGLD